MTRNNIKTNTKMIQASLFIVLLATFSIAQNSTYANASTQSTTDSVKYSAVDLKPSQVITPFGPWDADKVKEWDGSAPILGDEITAKWKKEHPGEESPAEKIIKERAQRAKSDSDGSVPHITDGWNMYTQWNSASNLNRFTGNWVVPTSPAVYETGDVIFTFIGLQTAADDQIIQPVLQYGTSAACSAADWRIASWYVVSDTVYYSSTCKNASSGNTIYGEMVRNFGQVWTITTKNVSTNTSTGLQVSTGQDWRHAFVSLETYHLAALCSNLPGDIPYTNLSINSGGVTPTWTEIYGYTWCGMDVNTISAASVSLNNNN